MNSAESSPMVDMKTLSLVLASISTLFFLSSCTYDPYYGYSSGSVSLGSYYGGVPTYGHSLVRTTHSRWAYDPYRRCYYDHHYRRYYNPVSFSYYSSPPRRYSHPVYPHGYRHGHGRISAPLYDSRKVRPPSSVLVKRHNDHYRDHSRHHNYRDRRDHREYRDDRNRDRSDRDRRSRDQRSGERPRTRTQEIQTARNHEAERRKIREGMLRKRSIDIQKAREQRNIPVSTPRNDRSLHSNPRRSSPSPPPTRSMEKRGHQRRESSNRGGESSNRIRGRSRERT